MAPTRSTMSRSVAPMMVVLGCVALTVSSAAREPSRHGGRRGQSTPLSQTAPDVTSTTRTSATPEQPTPQADDETLPPLYNLPVASRARMRTCGERWQAKKLAGQAGDEIWRDFATQCLSAKD